MIECEQCGSDDDVRVFYGREKCDASDEWQACCSCRMKYLRIRLRGSGQPEPTPTPEPEPIQDQSGLADFM